MRAAVPWYSQVREEINKGLDLDIWLCSTFQLVQAQRMKSLCDRDRACLCCVASSGEDARRPDRRKAALRRQHLDRLVRLVLRSRLGDSDEVMFIQQSDIFVFFDAGRHGNVHYFMGSLKNDDDKALACCRTHRM
jgi:hypothetical protein